MRSIRNLGMYDMSSGSKPIARLRRLVPQQKDIKPKFYLVSAALDLVSIHHLLPTISGDWGLSGMRLKTDFAQTMW